MFRQLALALGGVNDRPSADLVLTTHRPAQLSEFLEAFWNQGRTTGRQAALAAPGDLLAQDHQDMARPDIIDQHLVAAAAAANMGTVPPATALPPAPQEVAWHHVVYAALLEQTRIVDIFRRVIHEWVHGERLPRPTQATQRWLHATEQLFFNQWPYSVRAVTSNIRPDSGAVRRNVYWRMFAWDLPGLEDGRAYPYVKAEAANREFSTLFEALLTEVWRGWINVTTTTAPNETDIVAINTLVRRLREMLISRRYAGTLSREEFDAVAMLSWFHLTVEHDTQVVRDLSAQGGGIADRLKNIGERVGLPAHARTDSFFQLAEPMSDILIDIENGTIQAPALYSGVYAPRMLQIITHWSVVTGRNVKDPALRQPIAQVLGAAAGVGTQMVRPVGVPVVVR